MRNCSVQGSGLHPVWAVRRAATILCQPDHAAVPYGRAWCCSVAEGHVFNIPKLFTGSSRQESTAASCLASVAWSPICEGLSPRLFSDVKRSSLDALLYAFRTGFCLLSSLVAYFPFQLLLHVTTRLLLEQIIQGIRTGCLCLYSHYTENVQARCEMLLLYHFRRRKKNCEKLIHLLDDGGLTMADESLGNNNKLAVYVLKACFIISLQLLSNCGLDCFVSLYPVRLNWFFNNRLLLPVVMLLLFWYDQFKKKFCLFSPSVLAFVQFCHVYWTCNRLRAYSLQFFLW